MNTGGIHVIKLVDFHFPPVALSYYKGVSAKSLGRRREIILPPLHHVTTLEFRLCWDRLHIKGVVYNLEQWLPSLEVKKVKGKLLSQEEMLDEKNV